MLNFVEDGKNIRKYNTEKATYLRENRCFALTPTDVINSCMGNDTRRMTQQN